MKDIVIVGDTVSINPYGEGTIVSFRVRIGPKLRADILAMAQIVKDHSATEQLYEVNRFDYNIEFFGELIEPSDGAVEAEAILASAEPCRVEVPMLVVSSNELYWTAIEKHYPASDQVQTQNIPLAALDLAPSTYRASDLEQLVHDSAREVA
jgi:hypothetical protein